VVNSDSEKLFMKMLLQFLNSEKYIVNGIDSMRQISQIVSSLCQKCIRDRIKGKFLQDGPVQIFAQITVYNPQTDLRNIDQDSMR
jgi:hypothetical protein